MSTTNYSLPTVAEQDKATWLTTFNGAMNAIDTALKGVEHKIPEKVTDYSADIKQLKADVANIKTAMNKLVDVVVVSSDGSGITAKQYSNLATVTPTV